MKTLNNNMPLPLTQHVTNYELSKRLKKIGCPQQNSLFIWLEVVSVIEDSKSEWILISREEAYRTRQHSLQFKNGVIAAFLASELEEWLPTELADEHEDLPYFLTLEKTEDGWSCDYVEKDRGGMNLIEEKTLPDAMGEMVVYLKENGLIEF